MKFNSPDKNVITRWAWISVLAIALPMVVMALQGTDGNWDLRNYHLYDPHAWLTGRMAMDIAPAQLQSWHNPLLDVPLYLLVMSGLSAHWAGLWLTLPYVVSIFLLLRLQRLLSPAQPSWFSQLILVALALTGSTAYSTLATSTNDGFVAAAILASLWLILNQDGQAGIYRRWLLAGLVAGAITGLKLTAIAYCFGLAFAALIGAGAKERLLRLCHLALGGALGFLLTYAYWGWHLYATFRNPFFPYYNDIFHSPYALAANYADGRFKPHSLWEALFCPIQLLFKSPKFSGLLQSDPRLLIGMLALSGLYLLHRKKLPDGTSQRSRIGMLLVFFVSSFLLWVFPSGIYRYAVVLEMLGCLALVVLLQWLPRGRNIALLAAAVLVTADTTRPNWGHIKTSEPMAGIVPPDISGDSLVVIATRKPLGYLALGLPGSVPLVAVSNNMMDPENCTRLQERAREIIVHHPGPIWLLTDGEAGREKSQSLVAEHYDLESAGDCLPYQNALGAAQLCPQKRGLAFATMHGPACVPGP